MLVSFAHHMSTIARLKWVVRPDAVPEINT